MRNTFGVRSCLVLVTLATATPSRVPAQHVAKASFTERLLVAIPEDVKAPGAFHAGEPRPARVFLSQGITGFQFGRDLFASTRSRIFALRD